MVKKISLENQFSLHQKTVLLITAAIIGLFPFAFYYGYITGYLNGDWPKVENASDLIPHLNFNLIAAIPIALFSYIILLAFTKKGLMVHKGKLFRTCTFNSKVLYRKRIKTTGFTDISTLYFTKSQPMALMSVALNPGISEEYQINEINLLNENHTHREPILNLKKKTAAQSAIEFLTRQFLLKENKYNPRFY
ncbi:MAG: hypothetical protein ACQESK_10945 [Bacteroidota bacterium]